ncbi:MAG: hypothetical protein QW222_07715 [Candidatus Bathyarchaeia archaeon]
MDVSLKHIIGTIALIGVVISASLTYMIITSHVEADVLKSQLNQIAEYVALNLAEIVNLASFEASSKYAMIKKLNLPSDLAGKTYKMELTNESDGSYWIKVSLIANPNVFSASSIPINATQLRARVVFVTNLTEPYFLSVTHVNAKILPVIGESNVQYSPTVYGGTQEIYDASGQISELRYVIVWGWKYSSTIVWAGLGLWKTAGG